MDGTKLNGKERGGDKGVVSMNVIMARGTCFKPEGIVWLAGKVIIW